MKTLLIIDDEPADRFITENLIQRSGLDWSILSFSDATRALNYLSFRFAHNGTVPEFILLDLLMPVTNGFEFLESLSQQHYVREGHKPTVIVLTVSDNAERHRQALALGAKKVLTKPVRIDQLLAAFAEMD